MANRVNLDQERWPVAKPRRGPSAWLVNEWLTYFRCSPVVTHNHRQAFT
jgi:hypothetical protein